MTPLPRRAAVIAGLSACTIVLAGAGAYAYWELQASTEGRATADTLGTPGSPTLTTVPASNSSTVRATVSASASAAGRTPVHQVLRYGSALATTAAATTACLSTTGSGLVCDESSVPDGRWHYAARQIAGTAWTGPQSSRTSVVVDTRAPSASVTPSGTANAAGWYRDATFVVTLAGSDANAAANEGAVSGMHSLRYTVNAGAEVVAETASTTHSPGQGTTSYSLRARDIAGSTSAPVTRDVKYDSVNPTASVSSPSSGTVSGTVTVTGAASDATSGIKASLLQFKASNATSWTDLATTGTTLPSASWNTSDLTNGDYNLRLRTTDVADNSTDSSPVTVTVGNGTPINVALTNGGSKNSTGPNPTTWEATVNVKVTDADNKNVQGVTVAGSWSSSGTGSSSCSTAASGTCSITMTFSRSGVSSAIFTYSSATATGKSYTVTVTPADGSVSFTRP